MKILVLLLIFFFQGIRACFGESPAVLPEEIYEFELKGPDGDAVAVSVVSNPGETDLEGRLARKYQFYSLKFSSGGNYFSVNLPEEAYFGSDERRVKKLVGVLLSVFSDVFGKAENILGKAPDGIRYNITFGKLSKGVPHARIYPADMSSNILPGFVPYSGGDEPFSEMGSMILEHEIGHSAFAAVIGNYRHPKFKFIEEGVMDYLAGANDPRERGRVVLVEQEDLENMNGLAQMDIDAGIWGEEALSPGLAPEGYAGITHHLLGEQFIYAFIEVFGEGKLAEFLKKIKAKDDEPLGGDFGTAQIREVLESMGFGAGDIEKFETAFHGRLHRNVFVQSGE